MTDREIIQGLLDRDNHITAQFLYVNCRPLLTAVMRAVFNYPVEYDEMVSELYQYVMDNDGAKLRQFAYRSTIYQWFKVVATRFFIRKRDQLIEDVSNEPPYEAVAGRWGVAVTTDPARRVAQRIDIEQMLAMMGNRRYADTIRHLVLRDEDPELYAQSIGVTVANLYNIKRRAIAALTQIAIKYYSYGS